MKKARYIFAGASFFRDSLFAKYRYKRMQISPGKNCPYLTNRVFTDTGGKYRGFVRQPSDIEKTVRRVCSSAARILARTLKIKGRAMYA